MNIKLTILIVFAASLFALVTSTSLSGINIYVLAGSNDKCATNFQKDKSSASTIGRDCLTDRSTVDAIKDDCKQTDNLKCSSSQTAQGAFTNNPNKLDKGGGIFEKFIH
jgi:hypothetical protein